MTDPYELFVKWYLRLHGYFSVENFVIHEPRHGAIPQGGEIDLLAVRFPFTREEPSTGFVFQSDCALIDQDLRTGRITDFVIAEVKSAKNTLNKLWKLPADEDKLRRTEYLVRWLGFCDTDDEIRQVAKQLQATRTARLGGFRVRVLYFGPENHPDVESLGVRQITHAQIADFIISPRVSCYRDRGIGNRSAHSQWHPLIQAIWKLADPAQESNNKRDNILDLLASNKADDIPNY